MKRRIKMSNNLHAHSKDPGFQAIYKVSKLEKENEALVKRINEELIPTIKELTETVNTLNRVGVVALLKLGGSFEISEEEFNSATREIQYVIDKDTNLATFSLKPLEEQKDEEK
jgi:hypothetical protein